MAKYTSPHARALKRQFWIGASVTALFLGGMAWWSIATSIKSAVVASGQAVIDSNVKKVQHQSGGIVGELRAKDGDFVREGDILIRLDETVTRTTLQGVLKKLDELKARQARLEAERFGFKKLVIPQILLNRRHDAQIAELLATETQLYEARASAHTLRRQRINERIAQLKQEIAGLNHVLTAKKAQAVVTGAELESLRTLQKGNLVQLQRINAIEREFINLTGEQGQLAASIAQAEGRVIEAQMQIASLDDELRVDTTKELRDVQAEISQLEEKRIAAEDQLRRTEIRSPITGYVHQSTIHTVGGIVSSAEPLMLIVPTNERLEIEARISPQDIDQVYLNQDAVIRLMAFNRRTTPDLNGRVVRVGADVVREQQTGASYFLARISLPPAEVARLEGRKLTAGMQADVYVQTGEKSPLEYLISPLREQINRALRER